MTPGPICDEHNRHTTHYPYCVVKYWCKGTAVSPQQAWDKVEISHRHSSICDIHFYNDANGRLQAYMAIQMMELAWLEGQREKAAEIRKVLMIKET